MLEWLLQNTDPSVDWNHALITLFIRFIGVFVVLAFIQVALQVGSRVVHWIERRKQASDAPPKPVTVAQAAKSARASVDTAVVAAIGLALELEYDAMINVSSNGTSDVSTWAIAGRMNQVRLH